MSKPGSADLGDLVIVLLCSTLATLRDRLHEDGQTSAAELVADLVEVADEYLRARPEVAGRGAGPLG